MHIYIWRCLEKVGCSRFVETKNKKISGGIPSGPAWKTLIFLRIALCAYLGGVKGIQDTYSISFPACDGPFLEQYSGKMAALEF